MSIETTISTILTEFAASRPKTFPIPTSCKYISKISSSSILISSTYSLYIFNLNDLKIEKSVEYDSEIYSIHSNDNLAFLGVLNNILIVSLPDLTLKVTLTGHTELVTCLVCRSSIVVSGSDDRTVRIWSMADLVDVSNKVIYEHEDKVRAIDLSYDLKLVASLGYEGYIILYDLSTRTQKNKFECSYASYVSRFSLDSKYLISTENDYIYIWNLEDYSRYNRQIHDRSITNVFFIDNYILTSGNDKKIIKTNLEKITSEVIAKCEDIITNLCSDSNNILYLILDTNNLLISKSCNPVEESTIFSDSFKVNCISQLGQNLVIAGELEDQNSIRIIESKSFQIIFSINIDSKLVKAFELDQGVLFLCKENNVFILDSNQNFYCKKEFNPKAISTFKSKFAVFQDNLISVFNFPELSIIASIMRKGSICFLGLLMNHIAICEFNGDIEVADLNSVSSKPIHLIGHKTKILAFKSDLDEKYWFSADMDAKIIIWDKVNCSILRKISNYLANDFHFFSDRSTAIINTLSDQILFLSLDNFEIKTKIKTKYMVRKLILADDETQFIFHEIDELFSFANPFKAETLTTVGAFRSSDDFIEYIMSIRENCVYQTDWNSWIILPYELNVLHFYAYFNDHQSLLRGLSGDGQFLLSKEKDSPLSISISRNFNQCIRSIYKGLRVRSTLNPFILKSIEESLIDLNNSNCPNINKIYHLLIQDFDYNLPKFCSSNLSLPIIETYPTIFSRISAELSSTSEMRQPVRYSQSFASLPIESGSESSIRFMVSLVDCPDSQIFSSRIIQILLNEKWKKLRGLLYIETLAHIFYLTLISSYASYNKPGILIAAFVINILLFLYELWQVLSRAKVYFKSSKNYLEQINFGLMTLYCILTWSNIENKELFSIVLFFSWLRGISIFRLFSSTRYYIKLLTKVFVDIYPFFTIFAYSTVGFGLVFQALDGSGQDYFDYLTSSYLYDLGDSLSKGDSKLHWLAYFLVTFLNNIVMLNLIISIMSDTYSKVQENSSIADSIELANMLIDVESIMFWKRSQNIKQYYFICEHSGELEANEGIQYKIKKIKQVITGVKEELQANHKTYNSALTEIASNSSFAHMSLIDIRHNLIKH